MADPVAPTHECGLVQVYKQYCLTDLGKFTRLNDNFNHCLLALS